MEGNPTRQSPGESRPDGAAGEAESESERFGVVELRRLVKDDGRALLVFRRAADR